jgi:hypothetical protein
VPGASLALLPDSLLVPYRANSMEELILELDLPRGESPLKYVCLVYGEEKKISSMTDDECMTYDQALRNAGQCLASEALQPVRTAKTVRVRQGKVSVTDGPFAETKECLAGFYLIDAADLDDAIHIASQIPPAHVGSIEIRPVRELTSTTGERRRV